METGSSREARAAARPMKLVLIRANGALFYSVAAAALLESMVDVAAERLLRSCGADAAFCHWVTTEWLPLKTARARALREYVETTWPEFDFGSALHEYRAAAGRERWLAAQRPTAAHEALARCLAAAQGALFYRCLAAWAEDRTLRDLAASYALEEGSTLPRFRLAYEQRACDAGLGLARAWQAARRFARKCRDVQLPLAYATLAAQWRPPAPIGAMSYRDFVRRMRAVVRRYGSPGLAERMLFAAWARRPRVRSSEGAKPLSAWFRPVLRSA